MKLHYASFFYRETVDPFKAFEGIYIQLWTLENVATLIKINFRNGQSSSDVCHPIESNPKDDWTTQMVLGRMIIMKRCPECRIASSKWLELLCFESHFWGIWLSGSKLLVKRFLINPFCHYQKQVLWRSIRCLNLRIGAALSIDVLSIESRGRCIRQKRVSRVISLDKIYWSSRFLLKAISHELVIGHWALKMTGERFSLVTEGMLALQLAEIHKRDNTYFMQIGYDIYNYRIFGNNLF